MPKNLIRRVRGGATLPKTRPASPPPHQQATLSPVLKQIPTHSIAWLVLLAFAGIVSAQQAPPDEAPRGKVLFSHGQPDAAAPKKEAAQPAPAVTDTEREAVTLTAYDLDVHLTPATSSLAARVRMTLRNDGPSALTRVVVQVSSSLQWQSVSSAAGKLAFQTETVETDADHTGFVSEAVIPLPEALAPGKTVEIVGVYTGVVNRSSARLDRIGAPAGQASRAEWDEIGVEGTFLRGFGEVLWYPVAASPVFLGDGARFFEAIGRARSRGRKTQARLRLAVEYVGEPPHSAYFCGRLERMTAHSENQNLPVDEAPGIATAEFGAAALGFATPSLFVTMKPELAGDGGLVTAVTEQDRAFQSYVAASALVQPMLAEWYGAEGPVEPMRMIDHLGQPFTGRALVVTEMERADAGSLAPGMASGLSHAWMRSSEPWIEEGLAEFFRLVWMERTSGREKAVAELGRRALPLALADAPGGQSLLEARDEVYVRTKAAAVWWMLRSIVGDDALKAALKTYRREARTSEDARLFERLLEQKAGTDLAWFFDDWVYADKGLPDLSIVSVTPRELPAQGPKGQGWLVAVAVRNDGDAVAEVPVTVRSGTLTATERLRIAGRSTASTRILFEKTPEEVQVGDGETPEVRTSVHTRRITIVGQ